MPRRKLQQMMQYSRAFKQKRLNVDGKEEVDQDDSQLIEEAPPASCERVVDEDELKDQDFEDQFEDEFEEEDVWEDASSHSDQPQGEVMESEDQTGGSMAEGTEAPPIESSNNKKKNTPFVGSNKGLDKGEVLEFDNRAYEMLHRLNVEWPSLSIDFVCRASPFDQEWLPHSQKYPLSLITVQGSCNNTTSNVIYLNKWSRLHRTKYDDEDAPSSDSQNEVQEQEPQLVSQTIETTYDVNRIRTLRNSPVVAFWSDTGSSGEVHIMDLTTSFEKLSNNVGSKRKQTARQIILKTSDSGFALCWNPHSVGQLIAGDNSGAIHVYKNDSSFQNWSESRRYTYHTQSVEDLVFSPQQQFVFASCSSDGTLQIVDMRQAETNKAQLTLKAHKKDVNVCDWNSTASHLLVTGSDDCQIKIWDLRFVKPKKGLSDELLCFSWHTEPITSVRFQPGDESVLAVASEDNRLTIWDLAAQNEDKQEDLPNELLFLHQGQEEIKELCFHPLLKDVIVSSAIDSVNIFRPSFDMPEFDDEDEGNDAEDLKRPPIPQAELDRYLGRMRLE